jgi:hypothetical protein
VTVVVDTNVILVANGQHLDVSPTCVAACASRLHDIVKNGCVAIDDEHRILKEYQNKTEPYTGRRAGDAFLRWLLRNNANPQRCEQVPLVEHAERGFESFPDDDRLANFDPPDRKFVAVAAAHPDKPPILQAADSKWLAWNEGLVAHGVKIDFLCPTDILNFETNKKRRRRDR